MCKNTKYLQLKEEVKKLNKPILTMMALAAVLFINVQYADAEMLNLEGKSEKISMFFAVEGDTNILQIQTLDGVAQIFDSKMKMYKSGAFSLKNVEEGVALWAHPFMTDNYKITLLINGEFHRLVVTTVTDTNTVQTIEPKSSVGADITKYDIPTDTARYEPPTELTGIFVKFDKVNNVFLNEEYTPNISVVNDRRHTLGIEGAEVTLQVSRDGTVLRESTGTTSSFGKWNPVVKTLYPVFYPSLCYDVTITATYGNMTDIQTDDFLVVTTAKYWKSNDDQSSLSRDTLESDYDCND